MPIQNQQGQTSYARNMVRGFAGAPAEARLPFARPMVNPLFAQVTELVVGGSATAGVYSVIVTEPDGTVHTASFTRVAESNDAISDELVDAVNELITLRGICTAVDSDTNDLRLTFEHEGIDYVVTAAAPAPGTLVPSAITAAGGAALAIGRFLIDIGDAPDGQGQAGLPTGATVDADLVGISMRPLGSFPNAGDPLSTDTDTIPAGRMLDAGREGGILMVNSGGAAARNGQVFCVTSTAGGDELGEARGDAEGVAGLFTCTPVAVNDGHYGLQIIWRGVTHSEVFLADGSATATEICDGLRTAFGTIAGLTLGGTATLTVTGTAGEALDVNDLGPQDMGVVETTAAVVRAIPIDRHRAYWIEAVAAGAVGPLYLRM